ncbi:MAG: ATPase [Hellea sp.]|nr:ATPase [Hellea sp.]
MKTAKRFYKQVTTSPVDNGFAVLLDGRQLKTPGKLPLIAPSAHAAALVAAEWDAQKDTIQPGTMPVTRLVNVAIELTPSNRDQLAEEARRYGGTDLLCYRAAEPLELAEHQAEQWDPVLKWAALKGFSLKTTQTVKAIDQDPQSLENIAAYAAKQDDLHLTLLTHLTAVYGSAVLAIAVMERNISGPKAFNLSRLDNLYQIRQWGEDQEAAEIAANLEAETVALCQLLEA